MKIMLSDVEIKIVGRKTFARCTNLETGEVYVGSCSCAEDDIYDAQKGIQIATNRMHLQKNGNLQEDIKASIGLIDAEVAQLNRKKLQLQKDLENLRKEWLNRLVMHVFLEEKEDAR